MNRKAIRDLASKELGLKQPTTAMQLLQPNCDKESKPGMPCVVKPLMSSSGKGQSTIKTDADIEKAWQYAVEGSRGDVVEVIVEALSNSSEITLLTVVQNNNPTLCTNRSPTRTGDQESWQPATILDKDLYEAKTWLKKLPKP
jgi:phosphoribosylglycinamide formyltransferase 2